MDNNVKWASTLSHVREVSLLGTADLAFWQDRLREEELVPCERDGKARVMIVAAASKFMGVRFRELSISVLLRRHKHGRGEDGTYLVRAWNSCRFFALCERVLFSTPYSHGDVRVSVSVPASIGVLKNRHVIFRAEMRADAPAPGREPSRRGEGGWEGSVFLPGTGGANGRPPKFFFARLHGHTETHPFLHSRDSLTMLPSQDGDALQSLIDSHFVAEEWAIREDATHAKSKTYRRADAFAK